MGNKISTTNRVASNKRSRLSEEGEHPDAAAVEITTTTVSKFKTKSKSIEQP